VDSTGTPKKTKLQLIWDFSCSKKNPLALQLGGFLFYRSLVD
jgi:hypothetical protein